MPICKLSGYLVDWPECYITLEPHVLHTARLEYRSDELNRAYGIRYFLVVSGRKRYNNRTAFLLAGHVTYLSYNRSNSRIGRPWNGLATTYTIYWFRITAQGPGADNSTPRPGTRSAPASDVFRRPGRICDTALQRSLLMVNTDYPANLVGQTQQDYHILKVQLGVVRAQALQQADSSSSFGNTDGNQFTLDNEEEHDESEEDLMRGNRTSTSIANLLVSGADPATNSSISKTRGQTDSMRWSMSNQEGRRPAPPPLHTILSDLPVIDAKFFDMLDAELGKVATFYAEREKEMHERTKLLRKQLTELGVHRQSFYDSYARSRAQSWAKRACHSVSRTISSLIKWLPERSTKSEEPHQADGNGISASELGRGGRRWFIDTSNLGTRTPGHGYPVDDHSRSKGKDGLVAEKSRPLDESARWPPQRLDGLPGALFGGTKHHLDPHAYKHAKSRLRKAVVEHYRGLEALNNYRLLNLAGFRKVLKKYEKFTNTTVLGAYMKEKVEPCDFASGAMVSIMLKEMEHLFALHFGHGDRKKAKNLLRVEPSSKTHDSNTFRSGLWLGLALPAIAAGCYLSFDHSTRETFPTWSVLLFIYSIPLVPILMAVLIGVNILVWNWIQEQGLIIRNTLKYVLYGYHTQSDFDYAPKLPSFLLCTLAYGFWFSMAQLGPPMLWPLIWLVLTLVVMLNPFHNVMWGDARWWTIRKIAKLGASGLWNVEISGSGMVPDVCVIQPSHLITTSDQFCSLVYSFSNLYFMGCVYTHSRHSSASESRAEEVWSMCGIAHNWRWYFLLGMLPYLARFLHCLRRYRDSKLPGQLVNAGKYGVGIIQYLTYCYWRHQSTPDSTMDVFADWSMGQRYAEYPLLRRELVYKSHIPLYYFTLVFDLCIRFIWLSYIWYDDASMELGTFIAAMLEMLRRVLWNFYRVENKQVNNAAEYRITREVSLPYRFDVLPSENDVYIARLQLRKRLERLS
ncbi:EXS family-domain-containing protein [Boletus coccyginus]|nr:EXS family-domain-containing protein [Boletus coccyginus]